MQAQCAAALGRIRWNRSTADVFLGCYLTEPKPNVYFAPPSRPLSPARFATAAARRGLRLDARTQLLYDARWLFFNGAVIARPRTGASMIERLANSRRTAPGARIEGTRARVLYRWYCDGYLHLN